MDVGIALGWLVWAALALLHRRYLELAKSLFMRMKR